MGTVVLKYLPVSFPSGSSALLCLCDFPPVTHSRFSLKAQSFRKAIQVLLGTNKLKCREGEVPRRQRRETDPLCSLSGASMEGVWNWERRWETEREEKREGDVLPCLPYARSTSCFQVSSVPVGRAYWVSGFRLHWTKFYSIKTKEWPAISKLLSCLLPVDCDQQRKMDSRTVTRKLQTDLYLYSPELGMSNPWWQGMKFSANYSSCGYNSFRNDYFFGYIVGSSTRNISDVRNSQLL